MFAVAFGQLRTHSRRFVAIALAVILAVAFLTTTLMVNASTNASLQASIGQAYDKADLVVSLPDGSPLDSAAAAAVASAPGVKASYAEQLAGVQASAGATTFAGLVRNMPASSALESTQLSSGSLPERVGQVALDSDTAARQHLHVGSTVELKGLDVRPGSSPVKLNAVISGLLVPSSDPTMSGQAQFLTVPSTVASLAGAPAAYSQIMVLTDDGVSTAAAKADLGAALATAHVSDASVLTAAQQTTQAVNEMTGGANPLTLVLVAFACISLLVAALVVANTFSVLIAQRTRELALLRCLGADKGQIRRSVLVEAVVVGLVSSALGVALAAAGMAVLLGILSQQAKYRFATLAVPPSAVIAGLVVGLVLTVVAAMVPAKAATAVAPLAALRPADDANVRNSRGRFRLTVGVVLLLLGGLGLVVGGLKAMLIIALPAGAASFVGVLLLATLFIPRVVFAAGRVGYPAGVPGRLAAVNAVRNPGRTASTASALLIGVTLVAMMMTGAATARNAFNNALESRYPVDVSVSGLSPAGAPFTAAQLNSVKHLGGVSAVARLSVVGSTTTGGGPADVYALSPAAADSVLANPANRPAPGDIVMPKGTTSAQIPVKTGNTVTMLKVRVATTTDFLPLVSASQFPHQVAGAAADSAILWVTLDGNVSPGALPGLRSDVASTLGVGEYQVSGSALEKAAFAQVIDELLLVVTALLAVAVLIALIGVANTVSLSVLERTRENSLLRALGLTRGQLRGMLAIEAVLIAVVAAVLGSGLGILYGWLGAQSALGGFSHVVAVVPWGEILLVIGVAAAAGLLASVIPARRAAKLSPVEGLAVE